jgi:uncharacterized protein (TIGR00369 family)
VQVVPDRIASHDREAAFGHFGPACGLQQPDAVTPPVVTTAGQPRCDDGDADGTVTDLSKFRGRALRASAHPRCIACSPNSKSGLRLDFQDAGDGKVRATFDCASTFEGYPGCLHGGIISTILDSAMANCLFAQGHMAVTAELTVKFRAPVLLDRVAVTEASATRDLFPLFLMEANLVQDGQTKATATAKFIVTKGV